MTNLEDLSIPLANKKVKSETVYKLEFGHPSGMSGLSLVVGRLA